MHETSSVDKPKSQTELSPNVSGLVNVADIAVTTTPPESQLATAEAAAAETESRRVRLASNLIEQKHKLIETVGFILMAVIVGLYLVFFLAVTSLFLSGKAFGDLKVTTLVLIGMTASVPTILSITLIVGLMAKEKDKDEKSLLDSSLLAKVCFDLVKLMKSPH